MANDNNQGGPDFFNRAYNFAREIGLSKPGVKNVDDFRREMADQESARQFYDKISERYDIGSYERFSDALTKALAEQNKPNYDWQKELLHAEMDAGMPYGPVDPIPEQKQAVKESLGNTFGEVMGLYNRRIDESTKEFDKKYGNMSPAQYRALSDPAGTGSSYHNFREALINTPEDIRMLKASKSILKDAQRIVGQADRNAAEGSSFIKNLGYGLRDSVFDAGTWDMGISDLGEADLIRKAADKAEKGEVLTEAEDMLLTSLGIQAATEIYFGSDLGRGYKAGSVTGQMIPFMLEFALNPLSSAGGSIAKTVVKYAAKKFGTKLGQRALKAGARVLGDTLGAAGMAATTGQIGVVADAMNRHTGNAKFDIDESGNVQYAGTTEGDGWGKAIGKAFGARTIENFSEMMGNYFAPIGKAIGGTKAVNALKASKIGKWVKDVSASDIGRFMTDLERRAGWHGTFGEWGEEQFNTILNSVFVGDQKMSDLTDLDQQIDIFLGVAMFGGLLSGAKTAGYVGERYRAGKKYNKADAEAMRVIGAGWQDLKADIDGANTDRRDVIQDIVERSGMTEEQKRAVMEYAGRRSALDGMQRIRDKQVEEGVVSPVEARMEDARVQGREAADGDGVMKHIAKIELDAASMALSPQQREEVQSVENVGDYLMAHPDQMEVLEPYFYAKAKYEGMLEGVREGIEAQVEQAVQKVDAVVHTDGNVYSATLKTDDTPVNILSGDVVLGENGGLDGKKSSARFIVRTEDGHMEMRPAEDIAKVYDMRTAGEFKELVADKVRQDAAQKEAEQIDGTRNFTPGEQLTVRVDGNPAQMEVVSQNEDGTITVTDGTTQGVFTRKDLQNAVHEAEVYAQMEAEQQRLSESNVEKYGMGTELMLNTPDGAVRGRVVSTPDADGMMQVMTDSPVNGRRVNVFTAEQLDGMVLPEGEVSGLESRNAVQGEAKRLTEAQAAGLIAQMEQNAVEAPQVELTPENWRKAFGEDGMVDTPIGRVKMGENQVSKFFAKGREKEFGMVAPTLVDPDVIIEKEAPEANAQRDSKYLFVKTFIKPDGGRYVHFESVTVQKDGLEVSISSHQVEDKVIKREVQNGKILHLSDKLSSGSDGYLTGTPKEEGSDLVPASDNLTYSTNKDTKTAEKSQDTVDENVKPSYENIDPDAAWDNLVAKAGGDQAVAQSVAESMLADKQAALKKVEKAKPKGGTTVEEKIAGEKRRKEDIERARADVEAWKRIVETPKRREEAALAEETPREEKKDDERYIDPRTMSEEEKQVRGERLRNAPAVEVETGQIVATKELSARKAAEKWWDENVPEPVFYDTEVGEVEINRNSVESSLAHRYGQAKLDAITSLVEGFENAVYLGTMPDSRERGVIDNYFAYPINYNGKRSYVFCRAMQDANKNRLYVHEVFVADNIKEKGDTLQTAASKPHGGIALYKDILANVLVRDQSKEDQSASEAQIEESVPLNDSNRPTNTDNQSALLGINSSELSTDKNTAPVEESQEGKKEKSEKQPHLLPKELRKAYESGEKEAITKAEKALRDYVEGSKDLKLIASTYLQSKDRIRGRKDKESPEYKVQAFIAKTCKDTLMNSGIPVQAFQAARVRRDLAEKTENPDVLDVLSMYPDYEVLLAVIHNPRTREATLRKFIGRFSNNSLDYKAQQAIAQREENNRRAFVAPERNDGESLMDYAERVDKAKQEYDKQGKGEEDDNRSLMAVHNLSGENLEKALELGGFPMPSIAVTKAEVGHTGFGDISLVFGKESIDPSDKRNKVYGEDAWSPSFPSVGYKLNDEKTSDIYRRANKAGNLPLFNPVYFHPDNYKSQLTGIGSESLVNHFKDDYGAKQLYLSETGNAVKEFEQHEVEKYLPDQVALYEKVLKEIGLERLKSGRDDALENDVKRLIGEHYNIDFGAIKPFRIKVRIDNTIHRAIDYAENGNRKTESDIEATKKKINERVDTKKFEAWLEDLFAGVVEKKGIRNDKEPFTTSGSSRKWEALYDEITLDNVINAMRKQLERGGQGLFSGSIFGAAQREYKSIDEIREAAKERIRTMNEADYQAQRNAVTDRLSAIKIPGVGNSFSDTMDMVQNIQDAVARSHTPKGIHKYLKEFYPKVTMEAANEIADIVKDIQRMSARYFEAKPYRAVDFKEVRLAVVPSDTDAGLVAKLEGIGIPVRTYKKGNSEQRKQIVEEATDELNLRFQRGEGAGVITEEERALRDAVVGRLRESGIEVITDVEAGQHVLDETNGKNIRLNAGQKRALETASVSLDETSSTVVPSADGAKNDTGLPEQAALSKAAVISFDDSANIRNNLERIAKTYQDSGRTHTNTVLSELGRAIKAEHKGSNSQYVTIEAKNGNIVTVRLGDHNASVEKMDNAGKDNAISIVISRKSYEGIKDGGIAHIVEYFYSDKSLRQAGGKAIVDIARSLQQTFYSGEYKDTTGLAERQEVNIPTGIREHRVYHGSGAEFERFDHSHMGEGEGAQAYGWGSYVTEVEGIGWTYAQKGKKAGEGASGYVYTVEIPDRKGHNYLEWEKEVEDAERGRVIEDLSELDPSEADVDYFLDKLEEYENAYTLTGGGLYRLLDKYAFNSDRKASEFLLGMGYAGISVPAQYTSGGRKDGARNYVIFNEGDLKIVDRVRFFRTPNGQAYGFTVGGKIYIDPYVATAETPLHEYAHLWAEALRLSNPEQWLKVVELMKGTPVWEQVKSRYPELKTEDEIADEVLATYSGQRGAERLREEQRKMAASGASVVEKADVISALGRVKEALRKFWKGVADFLRIRYTTAEQVADRVLYDLLEGRNPAVHNANSAINEQRKQIVEEATDELNLRFRMDENALTGEERSIIDRAKADGTYMKAPNGKPTNLTEKQWVQVRTRSFKEWFGDWEKAARVEKLRQSDPIVVSGDEYKGKYELNNKSANKYILNNLRGEYTNKDTRDKINLARKGANKSMHHDAESEVHLKSAAYIPQMIENAVFITDEPNRKDKNGFDSYRYYVVGLNIGGMDYTARLTIGVKDGQKFYDHALTEIEKNNLLDGIDLLKRKFANKEINTDKSLSGIKDKRLLSILQTNSSKVVDENGEPLVVYHGSRQFYPISEPAGQGVFKAGIDGGIHFGTLEQAEARGGSGHAGAYFLNLRNPKRTVDRDRHTKLIAEAKREGHDGTWYNNVFEAPGISYVAFSPNQIKSATDNNGEFSTGNEDIRFRNREDAPLKKRIQAIAERVDSLAKKLNLDNVEVVTDASTLEGKKQRSKGFYSKSTGKITIVIPNHASTLDAEQTLLHEAVAHYGLRKLFGERFDDFLDKVFAGASKPVREKIVGMSKKHGWNVRMATEEYLASLAEDTDFEKVQKMSWWRKVKDWFAAMLREAGFTGFDGMSLTDKELRYVLWRSYENLKGNRYSNVLSLAADVSKRYELGVDEYIAADPLERDRILSDARGKGTYLKAPNGKKSRLTEQQWVTVRTKAFKRWFGDWEKAARIEKLRKSKPIVVSGNEYKGKYELNPKGASRYILDELRGDYVNKDTGEVISISRKGAEKVMKHDIENDAHLKSAAYIPQMIENAIFITEEPNSKDKTGFDSYRYYVCGLNMGGIDYTVKLVVGVKNGQMFYDHALTKIEKNSLIESIDPINTGFANNETDSDNILNLTDGVKADVSDKEVVLSGIKDKRLLSILQTNSSKVVDENGEPLVVYHGTKEGGFRVFDSSKGKKSDSKLKVSNALFFVDDSDIADGYSITTELAQHSGGVPLAETENRDDYVLAVENVDPVSQKSFGKVRYYYQRNGENIANTYSDTPEGAKEALERVLSKNYSREAGSTVYSVFLNIKKPLVYDAQGFLWMYAIRRMTGDQSLREFIERLKNRDYDGLVLKNIHDEAVDVRSRGFSAEGASDYVAFYPSQVKSATDNTGEFSEDADIFYREGTDGDSAREIYERLAGKHFRDNMTTRILGNREAWQDYALGLKDIQQAVEKTSGALEDYEDAYTAENQRTSIDKAEREFFQRNYFNPLIQAVTKLVDKGKNYDEICEYMKAKHGLERNKVFAMRDAREKVKKEMSALKKRLDDGEITQSEYEKEQDKIEKKIDRYYKEFRERDYSGLTGLMEAEIVANGLDMGIHTIETAAREMVERFEQHNEEEVGELWKCVNAATKKTLKKSFDSGMISKGVYDDIRSMFEYYVPLRGWKEDTAGDVYEYLRAGQPLLGTSVKRAEGRTSEAEDPIAMIGMMADRTITDGNKNKVKQRFLNLALNHPSNLFTVKNVWYVKEEGDDVWERSLPDIPSGATPEESARIVEEHEQLMKRLAKEGLAKKSREGLNIGYRQSKRQEAEHTVIVRQGGKEYVVYVNGNPRAAQVLNGLTLGESGEVAKSVKAVTRFMSANVTSRNPTFVMKNLMRDVLFSMSAVYIKEDSQYTRRFYRNLATSLPAIVRGLSGKANTDKVVDRYFKEFLENGGETGYTAYNNIEKYRQMIARKIRSAKVKSGVEAVTISPVRGLEAIADGIEWMNRVAEDISRFSVFMTSRQSGRSVQRSIADAKEITVNFNRKGSGRGFLPTVFQTSYMFFNVGVQALENAKNLVKANPWKATKAAGVHVAMGFLMGMLNDWLLSGGDDQDKYSNLPNWIRQNSLCMYLFDNYFLTIPLAIEVRPYYALGETGYQMTMGKGMGHKNVAREIVGSFAELLPINPLQGAEDGKWWNWDPFVPDVVAPLYEVAVNRNFYGSPIYKDNSFNKYDPEYTKAYAGTSKWMVKSAELLNEITGGDKYQRGGINLNPAATEHILEGYFGGVGKTLNQVVKSVNSIFDSDMRQVRNYPVVSGFMYQSGERDEARRMNEAYSYYLQEARETERILKGYEKETYKGSLEYAEKLDRMYRSPQWARYEYFKAYEPYIKTLEEAVKSTEGEGRKEMEKELTAMKEMLVRSLDNVDRLEGVERKKAVNE